MPKPPTNDGTDNRANAREDRTDSAPNYSACQGTAVTLDIFASLALTFLIHDSPQ
jgi:hypothetical protein